MVRSPPSRANTSTSGKAAEETYISVDMKTTPIIQEKSLLDAGLEDDANPPVYSESSIDSQPWAKLEATFRSLDGKNIQAVKEDIDTLLVFIGLFSAILTAFLIESYHLLQSDSSDTTTQILMRISDQLAGNSTAPFDPNTITSFQPSTPAIRINAFWFTSLMLSLVTASCAFLVKQWLRFYPIDRAISPKTFCTLRHFRNLGLHRFQVFTIAAILPIFLQIALLLFFLGLNDFSRSLHPIIGHITTSLLVVWLVFYVGTTLLPIISWMCPFKTPLIEDVLILARATLWFNIEWTFTHKELRKNKYALMERQYEPFRASTIPVWRMLCDTFNGVGGDHAALQTVHDCVVDSLNTQTMSPAQTMDLAVYASFDRTQETGLIAYPVEDYYSPLSAANILSPFPSDEAAILSSILVAGLEREYSSELFHSGLFDWEKKPWMSKAVETIVSANLESSGSGIVSRALLPLIRRKDYIHNILDYLSTARYIRLALLDLYYDAGKVNIESEKPWINQANDLKTLLEDASRSPADRSGQICLLIIWFTSQAEKDALSTVQHEFRVFLRKALSAIEFEPTSQVEIVQYLNIIFRWIEHINSKIPGYIGEDIVNEVASTHSAMSAVVRQPEWEERRRLLPRIILNIPLLGHKFAWSWTLREKIVQTHRLDKSRLAFADVLIQAKGAWDAGNIEDHVTTVTAVISDEHPELQSSIIHITFAENPNIARISFRTRSAALEFVRYAEKYQRMDPEAFYTSVTLAMT